MRCLVASLVACVVAGFLGSGCLVWLLVSVHALSPDNPAAWAAIGASGPVGGLLAWTWLVTRESTKEWWIW